MCYIKKVLLQICHRITIVLESLFKKPFFVKHLQMAATYIWSEFPNKFEENLKQIWSAKRIVKNVKLIWSKFMK